MSRRVLALRSALAGLLLVLASPFAQAAPDIAWEVRLLTAPWLRGAADRAELLMDAGSDPLDRRIAIKQGTYLASATGLSLGRTRDAGGATVVFPLDQPFTVDSEGSAQVLSLALEPRPNPARRGSWSVDLELKGDGNFQRERTLPLHPHRARLWVIPRADGVLAVLMEAWPANSPPRVSAPQDTVQVDLAIVRGDWRRGVAPGTVTEADFPTWLDPFGLERGESATALMRPVSAGAADTGTLLFSHSLKVPLGDLAAHERGRRPGDGGASGKEFLSATVAVQEAEPGSSRITTTLSLQSSFLGAAELVLLRSFTTEDGATQAWIVPTEDSLHAVFVRATRGQRALIKPVRPGS